MHDRLWQVVERNFSADQQQQYETLFAVGNGYFSTRGSLEERSALDAPATLVHGIYDHPEGVLVPELVNAPDWLPIRLWIDDTPFQMITSTRDTMRPPHGYVFGYERTLDMRHGLLRRAVLFRAASGNIVRVVIERFASLADPHLAVQRLHVSAVDGDPTIRIEAGIDADVTNNGVHHWLPNPTIEAQNDTLGVELMTMQSGYVLGMASKFISPYALTASSNGLHPQVEASFTLKQEEDAEFVKYTGIYTSRDTQQPLNAAFDKVRHAAEAGYDALYADHVAEWDKYWDSADIVIEGDDDNQVATRFVTYHILIAAPREDERVSIGAKTLSGLGYKGHVFWDTELFVVPPLVLSQPQLARNLLMYRYHNLQGARNKAQANGYEGAMFPWESTDTGEETTPQWSDPQPDGTRIRIWTGDSEQHISTDIAYAVKLYHDFTGDDTFMAQYGAEIILDTAVFWGSRVEYNREQDRYEISQQIGPDEYHENVDNSTFVNRMVVWHLQTALDLVEWLRAHHPQDAARLIDSLNLTDERLNHWRDLIAKMYIPFDHEGGFHIQFPGYFDLEYVPVPDYHPRVTSVMAILGYHRTVETQVIKQADIVMLMSLLGEHIGVPPGFDVRQVMLNNWNTYYPRCDHGSSLSPAVHARVAARLNMPEEAYELYTHAAHIDLHDNKGNVRDGMHAAACGGTLQALIFGLCGLHISENGELRVDPRLPAHWKSVAFTVYYRGEKRRFVVENPVHVQAVS